MGDVGVGVGLSGPLLALSDPENDLLERCVRALGLHGGHWGVPEGLGWLEQLCPQLADPGPARRQLPSLRQSCSPTPGPPPLRTDGQRAREEKLLPVPGTFP